MDDDLVKQIEKVQLEIKDLSNERKADVLQCCNIVRSSSDINKLSIALNIEPADLYCNCGLPAISYDDKVERAKQIAKHIKNNTPMEIVNKIKVLHLKLMDLEQQYLS